MARWNEDGSCAPASRMRGTGKSDGFSLYLSREEINEDLAQIDQKSKEVIETTHISVIASLETSQQHFYGRWPQLQNQHERNKRKRAQQQKQREEQERKQRESEDGQREAKGAAGKEASEEQEAIKDESQQDPSGNLEGEALDEEGKEEPEEGEQGGEMWIDQHNEDEYEEEDEYAGHSGDDYMEVKETGGAGDQEG